MITELPPPPSKIAWGPVLWVVAIVASVLGQAYVPEKGIDEGCLLITVLGLLVVPTMGFLAIPMLGVALLAALYDKVMFWLSLRRAARPDHPVSLSGQVSEFQAPSPADVLPPLQGFGREAIDL